MIKKIRLILEYHCYPVWLYDENDDVIDTLLPDELRSDFELDAKFDDLQERYDALFINNSHEFSYVGFKNDDERNKYMEDWKTAINELKTKINGKYSIIVDDIKKAF
jgi:hypothetical protein